MARARSVVLSHRPRARWPGTDLRTMASPEPEGRLPRISKDGKLSILGMGVKATGTERAKRASATLQAVRSQGKAASIKELDLTGNDLK